MSTWNVLFYITIIFCGWLPVYAQLPWEYYEIINTHHGLPHNTVQALLQDSRGIIWIGTYNGLCTYDGNKLKTHKDAFGTVTHTNWFHAVESLYEDSHGNVWIGTRGGLISCFIRKSQAFRQYRHPNEQQSKIISFCEDRKGKIWVGNQDGNLLCINGDSISEIQASKLPLLAVTSRGNDTILVLTRDEISAYLPREKKTVPILQLERKNMVISGFAHKNFLAIKSYGVSILDINTLEPVLEIQQPDNMSSTIYSQFIYKRHGGFYYMDAFVVNEYDSLGRLIYSFDISDNIISYKNQVVNCLIEDRTGILWLGTNSGLFKIDKKKYRFTKYSSNNIKGKITDNYIRCIYADGNDKLWIGYKNGRVNLLRYKKKDQRYFFAKAFTLEDALRKKHYSYTVNTILRLRDGRVVIGGESGLYIMDRATERFKPFRKETFTAKQSGIWSLYEDIYGNIWVGTHAGGLYVIEARGDKIYNYRKGNGESSLPDNDVWNIYEDRNGKIWIGTGSGLVEVTKADDAKALTFTIYPLKKDEKVNVWSMTEDTQGNMWIGTTGYGMFKIDRNRRKIYSYGDKPALVVSTVIADILGNIWISTVNGLYKYSEHNQELTLFNENDGIISSDFNFNAGARTPNGSLFFGSKMGMIGFLPQDVHRRHFDSVGILITSVNIAGKDSTKVLYSAKPYSLAPEQNFLTITFAIPEFSQPSKHRYRYILKGFDDKWNYTDHNNPRAVYTNLPPGNYLFKAEGSPDGIQWSKNAATLHFKIRPTLWQNPLFRVFAIVAAIVLIGIFLYWRVRARIRKERARNNAEKQIAELELKALQAQMNPHFVFNTINSIQHFILHKDELTAYNYLAKFAQLMRLYLESSKNRFISLGRESELLHLYLSLERLRFDNKFGFEISIDPVLNKNEIMIPSMLLQPFAENAIKHGLANKQYGGYLKIAIGPGDSNNKTIKCVIDDNGIGRKKASEMNINKTHISRGIEMIQERIKTYNFIGEGNIQLEITDKKIPEEGTLVEITIPIP